MAVNTPSAQPTSRIVSGCGQNRCTASICLRYLVLSYWLTPWRHGSSVVKTLSKYFLSNLSNMSRTPGVSDITCLHRFKMPMKTGSKLNCINTEWVHQRQTMGWREAQPDPGACTLWDTTSGGHPNSRAQTAMKMPGETCYTKVCRGRLKQDSGWHPGHHITLLNIGDRRQLNVRKHSGSAGWFGTG